MDFLSVLQNIGLNEKESKVYLSLLELQESMVSVISKRAGIKRSTTYVILEQLIDKGLVSHYLHEKTKSTYYRALSPKFLFDDRRAKLDDLEQVLPDLMQLNNRYQSTPHMTVYEGLPGLIRIMEDTFDAKTVVKCWSNIDFITIRAEAEAYARKYKAKKANKKLFSQAIYSYGEKSLMYKKEQEKYYRDVYLVPADKYPFKNEINIYDDKMSIISTSDLVGVIIQNKNMADTQRSIFDLCFEQAKLIEPSILSDEDKVFLRG